MLGFERRDTPGQPTSLHLGQCKLNVHQADHTFEPKARTPTPGSGDFCLITTEPIDAVLERLHVEAVAVEEGPVKRNGAQGDMVSVYFRDPDENLVEIGRYG